MSGTRAGQVKRTHSDDDFDDIPQLHLGFEPVGKDFPLHLSLDPLSHAPSDDVRYSILEDLPRDPVPQPSSPRVVTKREADAWVVSCRALLRRKPTFVDDIREYWDSDSVSCNLFCGKRIMTEEGEYQLSEEELFENFSAALMSRFPLVVGAIWSASWEALIRDIATRPSEQKSILSRVINGGVPSLIAPYIRTVSDIEVLKDVKRRLEKSTLESNSQNKCYLKKRERIIGLLQERINALENTNRKDADEEHKLAAVSYDDGRAEVLSISSLEEANAWMEALRSGLENRYKDSRNGRQSNVEFLWKVVASDAFRALFCGEKVIFGAKEYQIDIENCLINFTLAVTARSPDIVSAIWVAKGDLLMKKISKLPGERQIDLLDKVLRNSLDLIYPYVAGVMDVAVLEVVKNNLFGDSKATDRKRAILQDRINALLQMECQAVAHTQLISYPVLPGTAAGLAQFGLLPRPVPPVSVPPVRVPLESPNEDVLAALMMLGHR